MKYFAIFRDSFREAIDTKVFYFTVGLSLLIVLIMGSVRFRPVPAEEQFNRATASMNWILGMALKGKAPHYGIQDFSQTNGAGEPWEGDYRFTYVIDVADEKDVEEVKRAGLVPTADQLRQQLRPIPWIKDLEVVDEKSTKKTEFRYLVKVHGGKVKDRRGWTHEPALFFGAIPLTWFQGRLDSAVEFVADGLVGTFGAAIMMLLSTIITAFFIPNMLRKGTVDLLLSRPIHRTALLIYKYFGGLTFMFLNTVVIMAGLWLAFGLQTGMWLHGLLLCVLIFTFQFAIFYAVSTLLAVLTQSPIVAILGAVVTWGLLWGIGIGYRAVDALRPEKLKDQAAERMGQMNSQGGAKKGDEDDDVPPEIQPLPGWVYTTVDILHLVTPHYKDLDALTSKVIRDDLTAPGSEERKALDKKVGSVNWPETIGMTLANIVLLLGLACLRFATKDY